MSSIVKLGQKGTNGLIIDNYVRSQLETVDKSRWEMGFLIGNYSQSKDYGVHYTPAPLKEEDKSEGINAINDMLMATVAKELTRLLPGGLAICGLVVASRSSDLENCVTRLHQIMHASFKSAQTKTKPEGVDVWWHFIHMDTISKKLTSKSLLVTDYKSTMRSGDVKVQKLDSGWVQCNTSLKVNEVFVIKRRSQNDHFGKQLMDGLKHTIGAIRTSTCLCDGKLYAAEVRLREKERRSDELQSDEPIAVTLLAPLSRPSVQTKCDEILARIQMNGVVTGRSFHRTPVTVAEIEKCIKEDLERSLILRCELLCEDILQVGSEKHESQGGMVYETPPRVYLQLHNVPITFTDHMFKDETVTDCCSRARQLLGMSYLDDDDVITTEERGPTTKEVDTLWDEGPTEVHTVKEDQSFMNSIALPITMGVAALLILLLGILIAYFNSLSTSAS